MPLLMKCFLFYFFSFSAQLRKNISRAVAGIKLMISVEKYVKVDSVNFPTALDKWAPCLSYKSQQTPKDL